MPLPLCSQARPRTTPGQSAAGDPKRRSLAKPVRTTARSRAAPVVEAITLALLFGCQPSGTTTPPANADPATPSATDPTGPTEPDGPTGIAGVDDDTPSTWAPDSPYSQLDAPAARAEASRILEEVSAARRLPVTGQIEVDVVSKAGIREFAKESMYEHITPEQLALIGRVQSSLGVLPRDADAEQIVLDMLEDGVAGFYDPAKKTLFIGDFVDRTTLSMVVGHEIAHGLQDMHFDLEKHQQPLHHQSDREAARRFLIEGGAQATYLAWVSGTSGLHAIDDGVLDAMGNQVLDLADTVSPYPILVRSLQLPYADGTATVVRLVRQKGWKAIDALYERLPQSTEQMLHLDKLLAREAPRPAKVDHATLEKQFGPLAVVWHDSLGEAELLGMLADVEPSAAARRAAAGWGGDHYLALNRPSDGSQGPPWPIPMVVALVVWDTDRDAAEFEEALAAYLEKNVPDDHALDRKGDRVVFATGIPADIDASDLLSAAWKAARVGTKSERGRRKERG